MEDTHTINTGLKDDSHNKIEESFCSELKELQNVINNQFYSMALRRNVAVHFEVIAFIGNQPERRSTNYILLGNSQFCARYLYSADLDQIASYLPMCSSCLKKSLANKYFLTEAFDCHCCLQWNFFPIVNCHIFSYKILSR